MSISLTLSQPTNSNFGSSRGTHDFSPRLPSFNSRTSPKPKVEPSAVALLRASTTNHAVDTTIMTNPHRGLPPPSAMHLPDPSRQAPPPPPPPLGQPLGAMPAPPHQWQGQEESMRNWLVAKTEEDKRKQEEEKTRQEQLKLEQRRIEQSMLRESLQGGVPPHLVPMIYAGMGGANLAQVSIDWLQQYTGQLQAAQQHQIHSQQTSPELPRETRMITQAPAAYQQSPQQNIPSHPAEQPPPPGRLQTTFSVYQSPNQRSAPTSVPRSATHAQLPRLTTNEMYINNPPQNPGSAHPLQQSQSISDQPSSSPSIYFHHWVPPNESKNTPQTPAGRGGNEPTSAHPGSHRSEGDFRDSPRKRKAQGGHQANPPPSAGPQYTSPSFSSTSSNSGRKANHQRSRSNASMKETDSRPDSRREQDAPRSSQLQPQSLPHQSRQSEDPRRDSRQGDEGQRGAVDDPGPQREFRFEKPGSPPREHR